MIYTVTLNPTLDRTMHLARLTVGELNRATHSRTDLSGKGINVSVALRRFGVQSVMMGFRAGVYGRILFQGLSEMGHTCDCVEVAGETRSNITVIDTAQGITTKLNEPGPTVTDRDINALAQRLRERVGRGDVCVFSGSLPPGAPVDTYQRLIEVVQERGTDAVLDTSGPALRAGCEAGPNLVKPNGIEAAELTGLAYDHDAQLAEGLAAILERGPQGVLLTMGSRGAALAERSPVGAPEMWLARPPEIRELSAVGAGDASLAGLLWARERGLCREECVRWAVAAGTATARADGSSIPSLAHMEEIYARVTTERLQ